MKGYVVSDLHMYTRRSHVEPCEEKIREVADAADFIVLNGDIVDFKWSTVGCNNTTIDAATRWLTSLATDHPSCRFYYILGNHDAFRPYADRLALLADAHDNLYWHPTHLQFGTALFHHGDLLLSRDPADHWTRPMHEKIGVKGGVPNMIYDATVSARLHKLPAVINQPRRIARRVTAAVRASSRPEHEQVTDLYIGHTHEPFADHESGGILVHNTGSAMKGLTFNMLHVEVADDLITAEPA
jgi:UDP-2,3-diacylglucosamine hydrolase